MKKELLIAIFIGFILGLIITFGIITARRSLDRQQSEAMTATPYLAPTTIIPTPPSHTLFVNSPQPDSVVAKTPFVISGTTTPGSLLAVFSGDVYNSGAADPQGNFAITLSLKDGINQLTVYSYSPDGTSTNTTLKTVYLEDTSAPAAEVES